MFTLRIASEFHMDTEYIDYDYFYDYPLVIIDWCTF